MVLSGKGGIRSRCTKVLALCTPGKQLSKGSLGCLTSTARHSPVLGMSSDGLQSVAATPTLTAVGNHLCQRNVIFYCVNNSSHRLGMWRYFQKYLIQHAAIELIPEMLLEQNGE